MSINKNMNSLRWYMYKTSIEDKDKVSIGKNCRAFGFLDGYFDEVTYENYFEKMMRIKLIMKKVLLKVLMKDWLQNLKF